VPEADRAARNRVVQYAVIVIIGICYLASLSPGHDFGNDDFAGYVMHAENLANARPYASVHYVPNPEAAWVAPVNGYPPVFPAILAPVYRVWGLNLRAFKIVTTLCFVGFLFVFVEFIGSKLTLVASLCLLLIVSFNPVFWMQREYILSEFPFLMFSFGALLVAQNAYAGLASSELKMGSASLLAVLLTCAYGTRTIGIVLVPALVIADVSKFRRPSRFVMTVTALTGTFILLQSVWITWPKGYIHAVQFSGRMLLVNAIYYGKTLSYAWQNGYSKKIQICIALAFTVLAVVRFARSLWKEKSITEFYLLGYLAVLIAWSAEIGLRGLLPILPLYFAYGIRELDEISRAGARLIRPLAMALLVVVTAATYAEEFTLQARETPEPNVRDVTAQELFAFLREHTPPSEVLVFPKPRSLALFTDRDVASLALDESSEDSANFMKSIHATILVTPNWSPPAWQSLLEANSGRATPIFRNSDYRVFRIDWNL
jgi:hypothetical protein